MTMATIEEILAQRERERQRVAAQSENCEQIARERASKLQLGCYLPMDAVCEWPDCDCHPPEAENVAALPARSPEPTCAERIYADFLWLLKDDAAKAAAVFWHMQDALQSHREDADDAAQERNLRLMADSAVEHDRGQAAHNNRGSIFDGQ